MHNSRTAASVTFNLYLPCSAGYTCIFTYATIYWSKAHAWLYYKAYNSVPNWHCTRMQALASPPFQNSYESNETSPLANYKWTTSTTNTWPKDHLTLHKVYSLDLGRKKGSPHATSLPALVSDLVVHQPSPDSSAVATDAYSCGSSKYNSRSNC